MNKIRITQRQAGKTKRKLWSRNANRRKGEIRIERALRREAALLEEYK